MPRPLRPIAEGLVGHVINRGHGKQSVFSGIGGAYPVVHRRRWSAYVHQTPPEAEVKSIRRGGETGLSCGDASWVNRLSDRQNWIQPFAPAAAQNGQAARARQ